ncbi:MAG: glycosyltransferase family 4 protein, partial [Hydrogenovibrio sp.]|nr:glycosyltransferase family 4 protein [Hydrogenovibrio sp.]
HQQLPEAKMRIYGAYPPKKAQQLHNEKQGFLILGWAKEAFEVLSDARICLAPIRFGAGIKGKLAEAMVCGTPSVTTSIGAESMMSEKGSWPGDIADTDQAMINAAVHLYQDESHWQASQTRGFELFQRQYSEQPRNFEPLFDRIKRIEKDLSAHRQQNFIGAMLNHHHHKSTQYMAQWIEEKNKRLEPEREVPEK